MKGALISLGSISMLLAAQAEIGKWIDRNKPQIQEEAAVADRVPRLLVQAVSFGNLPAVVDGLWIRAVPRTDIVNGPKRKKTDPRDPFYQEFDLITDLDPLYQTAYIAGSIFLSVIRRDPPAAVSLLEKGERVIRTELPKLPASFRAREWSRSWDLLAQLGYNYLYELDDAASASRVLLEASRQPGAPEYLGMIAQRVSEPDGAYQLGLRLLNGQINAQPEGSDLRRELESRRFQLYVSQYLFNLNRDFREFLSKIPEYRAQVSVTPDQMERFWSAFRRKADVGAKDPFGGTLSLDSKSGQVATTTPHERVFGLD